VCDRCGKVLDVDVDASTVQVPSARRRGFNIETTEIVFRGVCGLRSTPAIHPTKPIQPKDQESQLHA
jgi:hypothetical protein